MGAYLSEPITKKISSDENGTSVAFGASSMQGWRVSQEDAHNCCIDFDNNTSLFAVYDGHGGHEVATYCAKELPDFIKNTENYKAGNIRQALIDAFLGFDETLTKPNIIAVLKEIAGSNENEKEKTRFCDSDEEESVSDLRKEAAMPLDQVIARYQRSDMSDINMKEINEETNESSACVSSPYLRCRRSREKSGGISGSEEFSNEPGCSSSSSSWQAEQPEVSGSSEVSTATSRSNGSIDRTETQEKNDKTDESSDDIPDSSADVKTQNIQSGSAESSKISQDDVSSSSVSENGQIPALTITRRKTPPTPMETQLYQSLIRNTRNIFNRRQKTDLPGNSKSQDDDGPDDEDEDPDDDDDDDENDETFDVLRGSSDDDIQDVEEDNENNSSSDNEENAKEANTDEDDEDNEAEEDDDDDYEDEDDDAGEFSMNMTEEPGSDSGCTAVVAILHSRDLYVANAGDSRCVLCRDGQALELSLDHKPEDEPEMERIIKAGGKVTGDGRVNGGLNLSRALGDHAYKQNTSLPAQEQMISALPDVRHIAIEPGRDEFMILACDGIWNFMSSQEVVSFIRPRLANLKDSNISSICEELFDHCLAPDTQGDGTGCDNMTAVIVKFNWNDEASKNSNNDSSKLLPNITSGQATLSKKRPISPSNTSEVSNENQQSSASDNNAEKNNLTDCTSSTLNNDSQIKDSCKRSKTEIV